jgi:hypothetical protein
MPGRNRQGKNPTEQSGFIENGNLALLFDVLEGLAADPARHEDCETKEHDDRN